MSIAALLAALAASTPVAEQHRVTIDHRGGSVAALYRADVRIETQQRGIAAPRQPNRQQCHWTAIVSVTRSIEGAAAATRTVAADRTLNGSRSGPCTAAQGAIATDVAARAPAVRERLLAAAEADRRTLIAELEAASPRG